MRLTHFRQRPLHLDAQGPLAGLIATILFGFISYGLFRDLDGIISRRSCLTMESRFFFRVAVDIAIYIQSLCKKKDIQLHLGRREIADPGLLVAK